MRAILAWGFYADRRKPDGSVGRPPRINPAITEIANSTIATKNTILAASIATPPIMPKPSNAAISAIIRKVPAELSLLAKSGDQRQQANHSHKIRSFPRKRESRAHSNQRKNLLGSAFAGTNGMRLPRPDSAIQ